MNLYNINKKILECIDEDTGEILNEELFDKLRLKKEKKIESIALLIKNLKAEAICYKEEAENFLNRKKRAEKLAENLTKYLDNILLGKSFKTTLTEINYRKSKQVYIEDELNFVEWAKLNNIDLLTFKDPLPNKTLIKKFIENGESVEYAQIIEKNNINIK